MAIKNLFLRKFVEELKVNHPLHAVIHGTISGLIAKSTGLDNKNALILGVIVAVGSNAYMQRYGHGVPF